MTPFRRLIGIESFKTSFETLLDLDEGERHEVLEAIEQLGEDPGAEQEPSNPKLLRAYTALRAVRAVVGDHNLEDVLRDIRESYPDIGDSRYEQLVSHFTPTSSESEHIFVRAVEEAGIPMLSYGGFELDFRVAKKDGSIKFVPVFVVRLGFDEHVSGSDAIAFQTTAATLERVRDQIDDALEKLRDAVRLLPAQQLPGAVSSRYGGVEQE